MTTLFAALVNAARNLEALTEGAATGGSTTTIIDSALAYLGWNDSDFVGGHAYLIKDAAGAAAAPEAESRLVTGYSGTSGTLTTSAFSAAVAALDWYGVTTNRYPRAQIVSKLNQALQDFGDVPTVDTTSLTTLTDTLEYSLPVACKGDLRQVWLARETAAPWEWEPQLTPYVEWAAANTVGNLIFRSQPRVGYKIKLVYMAPHPFVSGDTDKISDYVSVDWLALETAARSVRWRLQQPGEDQQAMTALLNDLLNRSDMAKRRNMAQLPQTFPRFSENVG